MSTAKIPTFRFAPSPNGLLHLGHAYSALLNQKAAERFNGIFRLRIEDIDRARSKKSFIAAIYRDLHWLGLSWPEPVRQQSDHMADYKLALDQLNDLGLLYPCFASRGDIKSFWAKHKNTATPPGKDPDGALLYPGLYKHLPAKQARQRLENGEPYTLRLHMDKAIARAKTLVSGELTYQSFEIQSYEIQSNEIQSNELKSNELKSNETRSSEIESAAQNRSTRHIKLNPARWGDVIIARKDVPTSYHLSVVVDDQLEGITHICRGVDLQAATDVHRILQINLGYGAPNYYHHELVKFGETKLSKSRGHQSLFDLREQGLTVEMIRNAAEKGAIALSAYLP